MTARQLHDDIPGDLAGHKSMASMQAANRQDNKERYWGDEDHDVTLPEDIKRHGVQQPVDVLHGHARSELWNGNHRVQAVYDVDPERYIPVEHHDVRYR